MKFVLLFFIICLSGCNSPININDRIDEIVDSLDANDNIVSIYKKDMQNYWFYTFSNEIGSIYDEEGNYLVSEIKTIGNKDFIVYDSKKVKNIDSGHIQRIESQYNAPNHSIIWYFAISKDGKKEILYRPVNSSVMPYAIPQIRNFMKSSPMTKDYEYIIDYITILTNDSIETTDISMNVSLYNHHGNNIDKNLYPLYIALAEDTFQFKVDSLPLYDAYVDDTLWIPDTCLMARFRIEAMFHDKKSLFKLNDRDKIRGILNNVIFVKEGHDEVGLLIPEEAQIHLRRNEDWIDIP